MELLKDENREYFAACKEDTLLYVCKS
jgi:hypothetical protein